MKFQINNLGKIDHAVIEPKRLTFFIGKNGSGKTYCASAIWAVINFIKNLREIEYLKGNSELFRLLKNIDSIQDGVLRIKISEDECSLAREGIQKEINKSLNSILKEAIGPMDYSRTKIKVINDSGITIGIHLNIEKQPLLDELHPRDTIDLLETPSSITEDEIIVSESPYKLEYELSINDQLVRKFYIDDIPLGAIRDILEQEIVQDVTGYILFGIDWKHYRNAVYLPAARTGIMLAINYFVEGALQRSLLNELGPTNSLPLPLRDFARKMYRPRFYNSRLENITHPLERIVQGKLFRMTKGEFFFKPNECADRLPLSASSSLVTELAGFYLLGDRIQDHFLIFEEPEAHLHLEAQREIAKYLAELVNAGAQILITTHSDTFLQQINNLITLSDHPKKDHLLPHLKIKTSEVVSRDSVVAYDFFCPKEKSQVQEIKLSKTGFIAQSLNDVLIKLAEETMLINGELDDDE